MIKNIQLLIELIHLKQTGSSQQISEKLKVSERMVYKYIETLKSEFNAPVKYDKINKTYFFEEKGKLNLNWQKENEDDQG
jgi:transcriptional antiterminator